MFDTVINAFCEFVVLHPKWAAGLGPVIFLVVALLEEPH